MKAVLRPFEARFVGAINGVRTEDPVVSITFDDGPDAYETPRLIHVLREHGARATFFVVGERARRFPELVRLIRTAGHEVGSHADVHRRLPALPRHHMVRDLYRSKRDLQRILGEPVRLFRPPFGALTRTGYYTARGLSLEVVGWSAAAQDWLDLKPDQLIAAATDGLCSGGILLMHERYEPPPGPDPPPEPHIDRAQLLTSLLRELQSRGLRSVSVGELIAGRPVRRTPWARPPTATAVQ
jgi:peptidoglycan/xylan/chitin deacetylase (PgdA/CDA1 family)